MKPALLGTPWAKARAAAVGVILVMLAGGAVMLSQPSAGLVAMPGPLSSHHAALADRCDACHLATISAVKGVLHGVTVSTTALEESRRCLKCHDMGSQALLAHSTPGDDLAAVTERIESLNTGARPPWAVALGAGLRPPVTEHGEIACASCHHEHRGRHAKIAALSNDQCQSCHAAPFHGLANGHPAFDEYPHAARTSIAFDHASHINTHFRDDPANAPSSCGACHVPSGAGAMRTLDYEASCAACHSERIFGAGRAGDAGLALLTLPAIDVLSLEDLGVDIGPWPSDSRFYDATITPFMRLLLGADPAAAEALAVFDAPDGLLDLMDATEQEARAAAEIARASTTLLRDFADRGQAAALERLERVLGRALTPDEQAGLLAGLPPDTLRAVAADWLGDAGTAGDSNAGDAVTRGGWLRSPSEFRFIYRPAGHADPFLRAWLDLIATIDTEDAVPGLNAVAALLRNPQSPGLCAKCHDVAPTNGRALRWTAQSAALSAAALTRFDHRPHTTMMADHGCTTCHAMTAPTPTSSSAGAHALSGFAQLGAESCVDCHTPAAAGDSCLACHTYHAGTPTTPHAAWGAFGD